MKKPILVIKFGSAAITTKEGEIDEMVIAEIARQVAELQRNHNIVLVSSGAVAAGKKYINNYRGSLHQRKAAAAIGNPLLLHLYLKYFEKHQLAIAQSLCERHHFSNRAQFLQLKQTYERLWIENIIPIANENDVVSNIELKFSDNDELATLIAAGFGAEQVLFGTSVPGVLDENGNVIPKFEKINSEVLKLARTDKSMVGLGGMTSKLNFSKVATQMGIKAVIFGAKEKNAILDSMNGTVGTTCLPVQSKISSRRKWLATGSLTSGAVVVDEGAEKALKKRKSLLAVGIKLVLRNFEREEVFQIFNENKVVVAIGKAKINSNEMDAGGNRRNVEVAHADDIVVI